MGDSKVLRGRAARLFALALAAREEGMDAYADEVTKLASDALTEAEEIERRSRKGLSSEAGFFGKLFK